MKRLSVVLAAVSIAGCEEHVELERRLASFDIELLSPVGAADDRCPLPGTPTTAFDLSGCPDYAKDAADQTVARIQFRATAIDNRGNTFDKYNGRATVGVVPGRVEAAFQQVRFTDGIATTATVSFRAAFSDTYVWITDDLPPPRASDIGALGRECGDAFPGACTEVGLACVNTKSVRGFDPDGLAYCTKACDGPGSCPTGYTCEEGLAAYEDAAIEIDGKACVRTQPTYASSSAGPIYLVKPNLADLSRSDSLVTSPFEEEFIEVKRGKMVVTALRVDGFYVTDTCPLAPDAGGPLADDPACTESDRAVLPEFNHLFVFNFSHPEDLAPGDQLISVAGPMTEFVGLTEMGFPFWLVNTEVGRQPIPPPVPLDDLVADHFPHLLERGARCFSASVEPETRQLANCNHALERLEAGRVEINVVSVETIVTGTPEHADFEQYGQWQVTINDGVDDRQFALVTRENIPFFDPLKLGGQQINQTITGNLRQVAFDDRGTPVWIIEPRDQADCPWCVNQ